MTTDLHSFTYSGRIWLGAYITFPLGPLFFFNPVNPCCRITVDEKPKNNEFSISTFRGKEKALGSNTC